LFTEELFSKPNLSKNLPISWIATLTQHEAAIFCSELVKSFAYLNRPYDIDHPIFYITLNNEDLEKICEREFLDTAYEFSTSFHRLIGKRRISFIPELVIKEDLIKAFFKNRSGISSQIIKCQLYYDEITVVVKEKVPKMAKND